MGDSTVDAQILQDRVSGCFDGSLQFLAQQNP